MYVDVRHTRNSSYLLESKKWTGRLYNPAGPKLSEGLSSFTRKHRESFHLQIAIVASRHVDGHIFDRNSPGRKRAFTLLRHRVSSHAADNKSFAGQGKLARLGANRCLAYRLVVDVE